MVTLNVQMRRRARFCGLLALWCIPTSAALAIDAGALTVRASVEARQIVYPYWFASHANPIQYSPDGRRYLFITSRGDTERDGYWVDLVSGGTESLDAAVDQRHTVSLFTSSHKTNSLRYEFVKWFDQGRRIAFLWSEDASRPKQVWAVSLGSGEIVPLTNSDSDVVAFDLTDDASTLIYAASPPSDPQESDEMLKRGFAVTTQDIHRLVTGNVAERNPSTMPRVYVRRGKTTPEEVQLTSRPILNTPQMKLSPNGQFALLTAPPQAVPAEWRKYEPSSPHLVGMDEARRHPDMPTALSQFWVVDTQTLTSSPLLDAPASRNVKIPATWSPDSSSVLVGPTFRPTSDPSLLGMQGHAFLIVRIDSRTVAELPADLGDSAPAELQMYWTEAGIEIVSASETVRFKNRSGKWERTTKVTTRRVDRAVKLNVLQDIESPPRLFAEDPRSHRQRLILEVNPELHQFRLGHVSIFKWVDSLSRKWSGTLYIPVGYESRLRPVPLVVQVGGAPPALQSFSLLGFDIPTTYAAQSLANRGIAVLNLYRPDDGLNDVLLTPDEPRVIRDGIESAINALAKAGMIDEARVGLLGFSRSAWYVQHILTHSSFRYAAANVCDGIDGSYLQYILGPADYKSEVSLNVGTPPRGEGLNRWFAEAPGFRTESIVAPLRMERVSAGDWGLGALLLSWETFSRMRLNKQAVELYVVPDLHDGQHQLESPKQQLASRRGTVDWFDFWLNGHEDPDPERAAQFERWRMLRANHETWLTQATSAVSGAPPVSQTH